MNLEIILVRTVLVLTAALSVGISLWGGYYLLTGLMSWRRPMDYGRHPAGTRFAVLIAARNEELVIGPLINSLLEQEYPAELYDIYVIPNNCTDNTALAARQFGAEVLECTVPVRSKGEVLRFAEEQLSGRHYDAFCVFDADNVVDPGFLSAMNHAWCAGARAAQGYRDSKNPHDTVISGNYSIYYWMVNRFYSHARNAVGLSAIVNGSGFMADLGLLREMGGWNTLTLTEDIEFTTKCILRDVRVEWVPQAVTYDEQPLTFAQSWRQRCRWSTGLYQCLSHYLSPLLRGLFTSGVHGFRARLDQAVFLLAPIIQIFWLVSLIAGQAMRLLQVHYNLFPSTPVFTSLFLSVLVSYAVSTAMAVAVTLLERKPVIPMLRGILSYWVFLISWLPVNACCLVHRTTEWKSIAHTRSMGLSQIK